MRRRRGWSLAYLLLGVALAQTASADPARVAEQGFDLRRLDWVGTPERGPAHVVDVFNPFGDIRLRPSESREIVAHAVVQELAPDQPRTEFDIMSNDRETRIRIALPDGAAAADFPGRVDLVVMLPEWVDVTARTVDGMIRTKSLRGHVTARTESGDIFAIFKKLTRDGEASDIRLETASGNVEVNFLVDMDLSVHVTTGGTINTLIPNDLVGGLRQYKGILTGRLGSGRHPVTIRSASGKIALLLPNAKNDETGVGGDS